MAYTFNLEDINGGQELIESVENLKSVFSTSSEFNNVSILGGANIGVGNEINELYSLEIMGDTFLHDQLLVHGFVEISNNIVVYGSSFINKDASFNSNVEISNNLYINHDTIINNDLLVKNDICGNNKLYIDNISILNGNVTMNTMLFVNDDTTLNNNLYVKNKSYLDLDVSMGAHLQVVGDVSMESSLEISNNLTVHQKAFIYNDVSFGSHIQVVGDVSMESSLEINDNLMVNKKAFIDNDASFGSHVQIVGDVSMESSLEISDNLIVHQKAFIDNDVSFGSHIQVVGDVSMESSLEISDNLIVHQQSLFKNDVSMETSLYVTGNSDFSARLSVIGDVSLNSKLNVADEATFVNHIHANKDININENLNVIGDISFGGQLTVHDTSLFKKNVVMKDNMDLSNNLTVHGSSLLEDDVTIGMTFTPTTTNFYNNKIMLNDTVIENTNNLYINNISTSGVTNNLNYNIVTEKIYITDTLHASRLIYDELLSTGISTYTFNKILLQDYIASSGDVADDISGFIQIDCEIYANRNSTFKNNIKIGLETESLSSTTFTLFATQDDTNDDGITYDGNITVGVPNTTNNRKLTVYGDLVIKDGGNIIIEDVSNTTITQLQTEVKVTDILEIHNDGTGPALTVNQIDSDNQDIVHFQDNSVNVFTIGSLGHTYIAGNVGIGIETTIYKLQVESTDGILIPRGTTGERPTVVTSGLMRYNSTTNQFEGYSNGTWVNFGGLTDIDRDTYITAEKTTDDDTLRFYTTSSERMKIDQMGNFTINTNMLYLDNTNNNIGIKTLSPDASFSVDLNGTLRIGGNPTGSNNDDQSSTGGGCLYVGTPNINGNRGASIFLAGTKNTNHVDYHNTVIETRPYTYNDTTNNQSSELLIYKGNDNKDRIRFKAGSYRFDLNSGEVDGDRVTENPSLTINENGYIGLFTTTPKYAIDISSDNALLLPVGDKSTRPSIVTAGLIRYNTETTQFEGYSSGAWQGLGGVIDTDQDTYISAEKNSDEDKLRFYTAGTERMIIQNTGDISMYFDLDVSGEIYANELSLSNSKIGTAAGTTNTLHISHIDHFTSNTFALSQNNNGFTILNSSDSLGLSLRNLNTEVINIKTSYINMYTTVNMNNNSITNISSVTINKAHITKLGINTTTPSEALDVSGNVHVGGVLVSDSDMKLKDNITKLSSTLDTIEGLNGYKYTRKDLEHDKYYIGVIAQEVELLYPELVYHNVSTDIKSVNYGGLSAVLIECVKHLKHQNQELYDKNQELEKRMSKLEDIINNLVQK